MVDAVQPD
uniref:Uncharacterized protein n=1 Tax=Arundo donax TaxID=35708 RepID=A0A0A9B102_ARUDO